MLRRLRGDLQCPGRLGHRHQPVPVRVFGGSLHGSVRARDRGEFAYEANVDVLSDMVTGAIWYRLLFSKRALDGRFARELTELVLNAAAGREASDPPRSDPA